MKEATTQIIFSFFDGMTKSSTDMEIPDKVEYLNPICLILSANSEIDASAALRSFDSSKSKCDSLTRPIVW